MAILLRLFVMMALEIAIWGAWAAKLFPYMGMLGFEAWQQSLVGSSWGVAALAGIFFSNQFADRYFAPERFLAGSHVLGGVALMGAAFSTRFWPFFLCYLAYSLVYVPTLSVANSIVFSHLNDSARQFGLVRMGGTVGWILASWPFVFLLSAHSTAAEVRWIFLVAAVLSFVCAAFAVSLPRTQPSRKAPASDPLAWRAAFRLLAVPFVGVLFVVTFVDSVIHNGYFVMADAFLTRRVGIAGNLSMVILSLGQLAEILAMMMLGPVLARLGWRITMIVGVLGHAARFSIFAFFPDAVPLMIAVQMLHGVCYAFFFATVYIFVDTVFPEDARASAQGMFNLLILGVGSVTASFLFPELIASLTDASGTVDYRTLFLVPTGMALIAALILAAFFRPPQRGPAPAVLTVAPGGCHGNLVNDRNAPVA